jgi:hypothetical protein
MSQKFPISQTRAFRTLATLFGGRHGVITLDDATVQIRFGLMFRAEVPRSAVLDAKRWTGRVGGWGAHGRHGRWLVNGSSRGIVQIQLNSTQRGSMTGLPVKVTELLVSVEDPNGLVAALGTQDGQTSRTGR